MNTLGHLSGKKPHILIKVPSCIKTQMDAGYFCEKRQPWNIWLGFEALRFLFIWWSLFEVNFRISFVKNVFAYRFRYWSKKMLMH